MADVVLGLTAAVAILVVLAQASAHHFREPEALHETLDRQGFVMLARPLTWTLIAAEVSLTGCLAVGFALRSSSTLVISLTVTGCLFAVFAFHLNRLDRNGFAGNCGCGNGATVGRSAVWRALWLSCASGAGAIHVAMLTDMKLERLQLVAVVGQGLVLGIIAILVPLSGSHLEALIREFRPEVQHGAAQSSRQWTQLMEPRS